MKKINLKSSELVAPKRKSREGNTSVLIGIFLLVVAGGVYGSVYYLNSSTIANIDFTKSEIEKIKKQMDHEDARNMYDFQGRLFEIEELLPGKIKQNEVLNKISVLTLPGTRFESLETISKGEGTQIDAVIVVPDHYELSKQLEAYSVMEGSEDIALEGSKQGEDGVEATVSFVIKK